MSFVASSRSRCRDRRESGPDRSGDHLDDNRPRLLARICVSWKSLNKVRAQLGQHQSRPKQFLRKDGYGFDGLGSPHAIKSPATPSVDPPDLCQFRHNVGAR